MVDLLFENGVLLTQDPAEPRAEALAVERGRIVAVGATSELRHLAGAGTRRIDLGGRTVVPGFNDAHAHVWKLGHLLTTMVDVRKVESIPALQGALRDQASRLSDGAWLQGRGYNEAALAEKRQPTREDLDRAVPDRPVVLTRTCGHIYAVNSRAMALAGVGRDTVDPPGGRIDRDERGEPTGILREAAVGLIQRCLPAPTPVEYEAMVRAAARHQLERGITSSSDCGVRADLLAVYRDLDGRRALPYRLNVMPLMRPDGAPRPELPERYVSERLRVDTLKLLADGGLSGATAALRVPYRNGCGRGVHRFELGELKELLREGAGAGWRLAVHAIGDEAIDRVLGAFESLGGEGRRGRHRIEHFGLPDREQIERAACCRLTAVPQTVFLPSLGLNFRSSLPELLLARAYPVRSMLEAGLVVALSSDAPVVGEDHPLLGMQAAVLRRDARGEPIAGDQAITAAEALYLYTMGGARATGDEANRGSLSAGKWADLAVLSDNPLRVPPGALTEIQVELTVVGGEVVFEGGER